MDDCPIPNMSYKLCDFDRCFYVCFIKKFSESVEGVSMTSKNIKIGIYLSLLFALLLTVPWFPFLQGTGWAGFPLWMLYSIIATIGFALFIVAIIAIFWPTLEQQ